MPRSLPSLGGTSASRNKGLLVLFPLNLRQRPPKFLREFLESQGSPGSAVPSEQWLQGDYRHLGLALLSLRLE